MTLVIDASATADLLLSRRHARELLAAIADHSLVAPQLLIPECLSVVRGWVLAGELTPQRAEAALVDLPQLGIQLFDMEPLTMPAWQWRHNVTAYDAMYVTLADVLDCPLLTTDRRLARALPDRCLVI